jgi:hypothetical protein
MKKYLLKAIVALGILTISGQLFAQSDSIDLNLYMNDPLMENEDDSLMYNETDWGNLFLEFDISDTVQFGTVNLELTDALGGYLIYKDQLDISELQSYNMLSGWHVTFDFGNLEKISTYKVYLAIGDYLGSLEPIITKQFLYAP